MKYRGIFEINERGAGALGVQKVFEILMIRVLLVYLLHTSPMAETLLPMMIMRLEIC